MNTEVMGRIDLTMRELLDVIQIHGADQKLEQLTEYVRQHPEIARMSAWDFLRSALKQIDCPSCAQRNVGPETCRYCAGTGKVDQHLLSHPMNVHAMALNMRGRST